MTEFAQRVQSSVLRELPRRAALVIFVCIALAGLSIVVRMMDLPIGWLTTVLDRFVALCCTSGS